MPEQSFFDEFTQGLGDAIADIRQKVVEEPYFGRAVTERDVTQDAPQWPQAREMEAVDSHESINQNREHEQQQEIDR
jgi:hypothetical protein